jgi:hypothetical protein
MPAAVAVPAIAAVAGGLIQHHAQGQANKASKQSQQTALDYEKQKDAERKKEYDEAKRRYDFDQQQAWKMKQGVLSRYGITLPALAQFQGGQPGNPGAVPRQPVTLGAIAGIPRGMMPAAATQDAPPPGVPPQGPSGGPPQDWSDWRQYAAIP